MLTKKDLFPSNFNYKEYIESFNFKEILNLSKVDENPSRKKIFAPNFSVDPANKTPFPPELDDLTRLHYITRLRKVTTILEFGLGKSTLIFGNALYLNRKKNFSFTQSTLRRGNLYQCHSVENYKSWIKECKRLIPEALIKSKTLNIHFSKVQVSKFEDRICTYYNPLPNISPDLIYLDGPDQFSPKGNIRGINTRHKDRMPMSADILAIEHFLQPGTLIIVDGRTANARFLKTNLQRNWGYLHAEDWDQHFFELQESPLGPYNKLMIDHCLGEKFYERID